MVAQGVQERRPVVERQPVRGAIDVECERRGGRQTAPPPGRSLSSLSLIGPLLIGPLLIGTAMSVEPPSPPVRPAGRTSLRQDGNRAPRRRRRRITAPPAAIRWSVPRATPVRRRPGTLRRPRRTRNPPDPTRPLACAAYGEGLQPLGQPRCEQTGRHECQRHPHAERQHSQCTEPGPADSGRSRQDDESRRTRHQPAGDPERDHTGAPRTRRGIPVHMTVPPVLMTVAVPVTVRMAVPVIMR